MGRSIAFLLVGLLVSMHGEATTYMLDDRAAREKREEDHRKKMKELKRKGWEDRCKYSHQNKTDSSGYKLCIRIGGFEKNP
jgi:hypothetical protein